jgi:cell division septation protein DedD
MRIIFITLLVTVLCPITVMSYADDKSGCIGSCSNDKRSKDMYCPPAGGYSDEDHKQCINTNTTEFSDCTKSCTPAPVTPEPVAPQTAAPAPAAPKPAATQPATPQPDGSGATYNK